MMRKLVWLLYTGLLLGANAGTAQAVDPALLTGDMAKLVIAEGRPVPEVGLVDMTEAPHELAELQGRWVVLNFWATWCAPCREEMPSLDRLQAAMPDLTVLAVATGPNPVPALQRFLEEAEVDDLTIWRDPNSALARQMGVLGLPVTVILSAEGTEVARLIGGAEWDSADAKAVLGALMK
jgi:thiol-disulfide isomerase/thioredoxin